MLLIWTIDVPPPAILATFVVAGPAEIMIFAVKGAAHMTTTVAVVGRTNYPSSLSVLDALFFSTK